MIERRLMFFAKPLQRSNLCASHRQRRWLTHGELMAINGRRVILGGLLAGLVNWMGYVASFRMEVLLFPADAELALGDWELLPLLALYALSSLVRGLFMVWLYSLFSRRIGRGLRTAVVVGVAMRGGPHPSDRCSSQLRWNPGS